MHAGKAIAAARNGWRKGPVPYSPAGAGLAGDRGGGRAIGIRFHANTSATGVAGKIDLRLGPAIATLRKLAEEGWEGKLDFAFLDAEKTEYDEYYELTLPLLRQGGLVVLDNMLRDGGVADPKVQDKGTRAIRALNKKIAGDKRVEAVLLPLADGLTVARKLG